MARISIHKGTATVVKRGVKRVYRQITPSSEWRLKDVTIEWPERHKSATGFFAQEVPFYSADDED